MRLMAFALLISSSGVAAATTELDCTDPNRQDNPHWAVILNEENGTASVDEFVNRPAVYLPNEVRITESADQIAASIFSINRTTLAWKLIYRIAGQEKNMDAGQCKIVSNPDRKI